MAFLGDRSLSFFYSNLPSNEMRLDCGLDRGLSVCADYESPFTFTGQIESVKVSIGEQRPVDYSKILQASFSEQ